MNHFADDRSVSNASWQGFERLVARLTMASGFQNSRLIGGSGDGGADLLATKNGKRWLFQMKNWAQPVGPEVIARTTAAMRSYGADIPVIVSRNGFTRKFHEQRAVLAAQGLTVQAWDRPTLQRHGARLSGEPPVMTTRDSELRSYQEDAVEAIIDRKQSKTELSALVVLATGLGKTFVAAESVRRLSSINPDLRVLVLAHTNDLVYQLERAFWPFLRSNQRTVVVNGAERPAWSELSHYSAVFASKDTLAVAAENGVSLPEFDVIIVDECHHLGAVGYDRLLTNLHAAEAGGAFLLGLTATPWRPDGASLDQWFDGPVVSIDLVRGLRTGFLANVDYRMFTDNVDWSSLSDLRGSRFSPKAINKTLFVDEWDDAVVRQVQQAWQELRPQGRGIVFCGTVDHAERVAGRINALGFTAAKALYSRSSTGIGMSAVERAKALWDFADGRYGILCAVDVLNEGIDVPDVNLIAFQRVTHSRRIFVQQLGRGLRVSPGKSKTIVLDFVSDVRRFAAGLELKRDLANDGPRPGSPVRIKLPSSITFQRANDPDLEGESFLRQWLGDLESVAESAEDDSILRYPPIELLPGTDR